MSLTLHAYLDPNPKKMLKLAINNCIKKFLVKTPSVGIFHLIYQFMI